MRAITNQQISKSELHQFEFAFHSYAIKHFFISVVVIALLSTFGGYFLSRLILNGTNIFSQQRTEKLLVIQQSLDDAAITLGRQIQEWKDMLLRINNKEVFTNHQKAFIDDSVGVQNALLQAKTTMQNINWDTKEIDQLIIEHKTLLTRYILAQNILKLPKIQSANEVDSQVIGVDRNLQKHLATVKANVEFQIKNQVNGGLSVIGNRDLLAEVLGISLWFMALIGFGFAYFLTSQSLSVNHT